MLVTGVEYENKFSEEIKKRLDNKSDKHDYQYEGEKMLCNAIVRLFVSQFVDTMLNPFCNQLLCQVLAGLGWVQRIGNLKSSLNPILQGKTR